MYVCAWMQIISCIHMYLPLSDHRGKREPAITMSSIGPAGRWQGKEMVTEVYECLHRLPVVEVVVLRLTTTIGTCNVHKYNYITCTMYAYMYKELLLFHLLSFLRRCTHVKRQDMGRASCSCTCIYTQGNPMRWHTHVQCLRIEN